MDTILEMRNITKTFPGVKALDNVNMKVRRGEIHALCGENGAGKSTLMKILSGVYPHGSYEGAIFYEGQEKSFRGINDSEAEGIVIIHQELALVPQLSIAENIFLGNECAKNGVIDWSETYRRTAELLARVGLKDSPRTKISDLGLGKQQLVEIAKALAKDVKLLILDEPTSSLNEKDSAALLELMLEFKRRGISAILISHKLNEVSKVSDSITVLRDGQSVSTREVVPGQISEDDIIREMVGRSLSDRYPPREPKIGEVLLEVKNWNVRDPQHSERMAVDDVSFSVRAGEVVGIAGLMGAGRTELAMSLFGRSWGSGINGTVEMRGQPVDTSTVKKAIAAGICYVTEDRKSLGLVLDDSIRHNTTLANLEGVSERGIIDSQREISVAEDYRKRLNVKSSGIAQATKNLSGGNQQKVVLGKWLFADPQILILDEPTRGIDVGAKYEIYTIIRDLAASGRGILVISSEMPELLGICDRLYVMNEGRFLGQMQAAEASQEKIMSMIIRADGRAA
ncbi:multiple monosaccharide ABC transporter ATP-binding protein [Oceanicella sp. SM1341]|uniref:multiple monosaccharide ABC transporter ATP-binding protein n=1 Tax=Oceanicella sp. SM1341 TaxID=1548889 RepID=UPI000E54CC12|nr:multiple monosaccharide ABC transporter ATP-binding protein [Oceanicella sp. SM1341]